jgi:predicted nuclease with TOPRIM domain
MDIATGLGIAKTSLDLIRGVREALKKKTLSNEEIVAYLSDLQDRIVDLKTALSDADEENRHLKHELEEAKWTCPLF